MATTEPRRVFVTGAAEKVHSIHFKASTFDFSRSDEDPMQPFLEDAEAILEILKKACPAMTCSLLTSLLIREMRK